MSPRFGRNAGAGDHERARDLASLRMDEPLADGDARWLDAHLGSCPACAAMAASFDDDRLLLRSLRTAEPQAPRDLWARTAAALEAEADRHPGRPVPVRGRFGSWQLAPLAAVAVAAVAVGVALLPGTLLPAGGGDVAVATPITLTAGNVQVLRRGEDGSLEIQTSSVDQVCPSPPTPALRNRTSRPHH